MIRHGGWKRFSIPFLVSALAAVIAVPNVAAAQDFQSQSLVRRISGASEKLELITNTSRILTLEKNIPRVQVNNPELLAVTPLSATQVQISAKKAGVTQVNLWDEDGNIHTVDVLIYGDARELEIALQTQFPHSSIKVYRYSDSLVLKGFVDQPENVTPIMRLAEDYAPKVINNMAVGGAQQVLLKVKVMEVSRTKLRQLGVDWAWFGRRGGFAVSRVGDLITDFGETTQSDALLEFMGDTFSFGIIGDSSAFFGVLDALQSQQVAKILAEPNLVAISGRPARFSSGGEIPILVPQSLGMTSIEFKEFGTIVDFVPIVLGNGRIHLEVRPEVSTRDDANGITVQGTFVPGFKQRRVNTAVEMSAGQTFVLAGLVEERIEAQNRGLPYLSDVPVFGVPFRRTRETTNEIELLILVTPQFVDAMDPHEVPPGGPGYATVSPTNSQLYCAGHVEVPPHCNPIRGPWACGEYCGAGFGPHAPCHHHHVGPHGPPHAVVTDGLSMPGGVGYDEPVYGPAITEPLPPMPDDFSLPNDASPPNGAQVLPPGPSPGHSAAAAGPYSPPRQPVFLRNAGKTNNQQGDTTSAAGGGLIGPVGYDAQ